MNEDLDRMADHCRRQRDSAKAALDQLEAGVMHSGERTIAHPHWRNTTEETKAMMRNIVAQMERQLERIEEERERRVGG